MGMGVGGRALVSSGGLLVTVGKVNVTDRSIY